MTARTVLLAMHDSAPGGAGVAALRDAAHLPEQGWQPESLTAGPKDRFTALVNRLLHH